MTSHDLMATKHDLVGATFGRLTVESRGPDYVTPADGRHRPQWWCRCSCPKHTLKLFPQNGLLEGNIVSCGCKQVEDRKRLAPAISRVFAKSRHPQREVMGFEDIRRILRTEVYGDIF